ncbi:MAG: CoA-binding protein, partial [Halobacteriota archaeon]|nr:CoA-binding protein [Halobacteriota archaeon]
YLNQKACTSWFGVVMSSDLDALFEPKTIALIGATTKMKFGYGVTKDLLESDFKVYPVHPKETEIMGEKVYRSIEDIPDDIDLAIIVIPASKVKNAMEECARKGVKGVIIESAGFSETGEEGKKLEDEVVAIAKENGIRVVGPNCVGLMNMANDLSTTGIKTDRLTKGGVSVIAQSGVLGNILLEWAPSQNIRFSKVITVGNKCDVNEIDLMEYFANDDDTKVIVIYLEGVKGGERFIEVAKNVTKKKPVIVVKSGRTELGSKAVASHTGSIAGEDRIYDAVFSQTGILRFGYFEEAFAVAKTFDFLPLPKGNRLAIVTSSGSMGALACDECVAQDMRLADFDPKTIEKIKKSAPDWVTVKNPMDVGPSGLFVPAVKEIMKDDGVDAVILIMVAPLTSFGGSQIFDMLFGSFKGMLSKFRDKPFVFCTFGDPDLTIKKAREHLEGSGIPVFTSPQTAVKSIASLYRYGEHIK